MTKTAHQAFKETAEKDIKYNDTYRAFIYGIDCMIDESIKSGKYFVRAPLITDDKRVLPMLADYYRSFGYNVSFIYSRRFDDIPTGLQVMWYD